MGVGIKHERAGGWENEIVTIGGNLPDNLPSFSRKRDAPNNCLDRPPGGPYQKSVELAECHVQVGKNESTLPQRIGIDDSGALSFLTVK